VRGPSALLVNCFSLGKTLWYQIPVGDVPFDSQQCFHSLIYQCVPPIGHQTTLMFRQTQKYFEPLYEKLKHKALHVDLRAGLWMMVSRDDGQAVEGRWLPDLSRQESDVLTPSPECPCWRSFSRA
jgi:hypothetical protein